MKQDDDVTRDALGLPYTPRPLPQRPARDLLAGAEYRSSADTNLRRTFARIRREMKLAEKVPAGTYVVNSSRGVPEPAFIPFVLKVRA